MDNILKLFYGCLVCCVANATFTSCAGEEDDIFDKTAAERLNESSAKYSARLEAQPNGWAMQYYPTYYDESPQGSGYLILMRFNPDYSVDVSMDNRFSGNVYATATSGWEVIKDNGPVLTFNTYNRCMHAFSDPEDISWTSDSEQSEGCGGDYEFIIVDAPEDASYMMLKGKKRNTYNLLTPVEEGVDYQQYLADVKAFHNKIFSADAPTGCYLCFGADSIYCMDDASDGVPNIYPMGTDAIANESFHPFLVTKRGQDYYLRFRDAFEKDYLDGKLQELRYDSIQDCFFGTDNAEFVMRGYPVPRFFREYSNAKGDRHCDISTEQGMVSDKFRTYLAPDSETAGYASVPGETVAVSDVLDVPISRGCDLYLAWNITVASGDAANAAMAIGIDDFSVSGELPTIPASKYYIYVDDQTGWDALGLYAWGDSELFGAWPGEASVGEVSFNKETTYKVFLLDTEGGNYNLIFNNWNNGKQLPDYNITANRDYYFQIDENTVTEVEVVSGVENIVDSKTAINMNGNIVSFPGMIEVYNINGQRVAQGNNTLSIAELSRGIYVVRASNGKQVTSLKVAR